VNLTTTKTTTTTNENNKNQHAQKSIFSFYSQVIVLLAMGGALSL